MATTFENTLSDSSLSRLILTPETVWGGTTANGSAIVLPFTSESLTYTPTTVVSATITRRRTQSDLILANLQAEGDVDAEFTEGNFDGLLKASLLSTGSVVADPLSWVLGGATSAAITLTGGASFNNASQKGQITYSNSSAPSRAALTGLIKGQVIKVSGAHEDPVSGSIGSLNGTYTVLSSELVSGAVVIKLLETLKNADGTTRTAAIAETGNDLTITTQRIADGNAVDDVNRLSFTVEKQLRLGGTANKYFLYRGMMVNSLTFTVSAQELATVSTSFIGKNSEAFETGNSQFATINARGVENATGLTVADLADAVSGLDNPSVNGSDDFNGIYQGGELQALVSSFTLTINNNLRAQNALGTLGAVSLGVGTSEVTGSVDVYLKDLSMYDKFINNETSSMQFRFTATDEGGVSQTYQIYLPKIKFSNVEQPISANNTDVITTGTFQALYDDASKASIVISKA